MTMSKIILLLAVLAPLGIAAASTDCSGPPPLKASFVCSSERLTKDLHDPCIRMMIWGGIDMSSPTPHEEGATGYVTLAAWYAVESLDVTQIAARNQRNHNTSLSGHERDAYEGCVKDYTMARGSMDRIAGEMLPSCRFEGLGNEYKRVLHSLARCTDRLPVKTPLYRMVWADRNKVGLAYLIANLIGV